MDYQFTLKNSPQTSPQIGFFDLISQLDAKHPLSLLADEIDWVSLNRQLSAYSEKSRPKKHSSYVWNANAETDVQPQ